MSTTKHYIDGSGSYLGGFGDGAEPPAESIEVDTPPKDGRDRFINGAWVDRDVSTEEIQSEANALLEVTDWIFIPDANISTQEKNAIIGFRQAVRAVSHSPRPHHLGFPPLENGFIRNGR